MQQKWAIPNAHKTPDSCGVPALVLDSKQRSMISAGAGERAEQGP